MWVNLAFHSTLVVVLRPLKRKSIFAFLKTIRKHVGLLIHLLGNSKKSVRAFSNINGRELQLVKVKINPSFVNLILASLDHILAVGSDSGHKKAELHDISGNTWSKVDEYPYAKVEKI